MKLLPGVFTFAILGAVAAPALGGNCGSENMGYGNKHSYQEMAETYFDHMDLNKDKVLDKAEFEKSKFSKIINSFDVLQPNENDVVQRDTFIKTFMEAHSKPAAES